MKLPKYKKLAGELETAIQEGLLLPGARLPSVRELMTQHGLSLATVTSALRLLEEKGLIEARAKSGYFVKVRRFDPGLPATDCESGPPSNVQYWLPAEDLYPEERFKKLMASVIRRHPYLAVRPLRESNHPKLVRELVKRSAESGCFLREREILVTQGAAEAISLALRAVVRMGDRVAVQAPMTPWLSRLMQSLGVTPILLDFTVSDGLVGALKKELAESDSPPKVLLVNPNFHCPTGGVLSLRDKRELLRIAEAHDLVVVEDDIFGDLQYEGSRPLPMKSFDSSGRVIYINSTCRSLAPGLQIGWMAVAEPWRERIETLKISSSSAVGELMQLVLAEFLAAGSHLPHLRKLRAKLKARAESYFEILAPALGDLVTMPELSGAYSYYLPLSVPPGDQQVRAWSERWPNLFDSHKPIIAFAPQGLCLNTSHALRDEDREALKALCSSIKSHLEQAA